MIIKIKIDTDRIDADQYKEIFPDTYFIQIVKDLDRAEKIIIERIKETSLDPNIGSLNNFEQLKTLTEKILLSNTER